jgi:hypothetical protein
MKHFKTPKNDIRAIDSDQEFLIESDWVELSDAELAAALAPTTAEINQRRISVLKEKLASTDYKLMPDYDKPSETIKQQRQSWREEIRTLSA